MYQYIAKIYQYHKQTVFAVDAHLAQLFVQSGGPGLSCCVAMRTEHLLVPVNEVAVTQPDHLHTNTQTSERGIWFH